MCKLFNLHKKNKNFTTDVKSCSTEKNIKFIKFNKQSMDFNKTLVTEKNLVRSLSGYKFFMFKICILQLFNNIYFRMCKNRKKSWKNSKI